MNGQEKGEKVDIERFEGRREIEKKKIEEKIKSGGGGGGRRVNG